MSDETPQDERGLRERMKDDFAAYRKAKGIQAYEAAKRYLVSKAKVEKKKAPAGKQKKISALNPRDLTPEGEVLQVGRSPIKKSEYDVTFMTGSGTVRKTFSGSDKIDVIGQGEVR
ncbi:hypothetical protein AXJ18_gp138 [Streptomyces phage Jay2Jay]|uniref:Uncharacterized protein n=2 Tax=Samistivirus jay2jay TaxID=2560786 RepID=A0A221SB50_9CAUD|nr:hypothetical protein AXJ18_gp138 [Streptomyces phage Jay2Jay]AIW02636.1 hypothetical protein PBI_JAY2JAY_159 [Streptomyces phage Jay2Jay]ASN73211.1 hypothetical protein SEA_WARPY_158 [Streptomyces phage Warpy]